MKRKTLALAELTLAARLRELQHLEATIDSMPNIAVRRIPFVLAQIESLRKMIRQGQMEQVRRAAVAVARTIKESATNDETLHCESCRWGHPMPEATGVMHVHHVVPIASGGDNEPENLTILCPNCHATAHTLLHRGLNVTTRTELLAVLETDPLNDIARTKRNATLR